MLKEQYKESQDKLSKAKTVWTTLPPEFVFLIDRVSSSSNPRINCSKRNRQKRAEVLARYVTAGFHSGSRSLTYSIGGARGI